MQRMVILSAARCWQRRPLEHGTCGDADGHQRLCVMDAAAEKEKARL